jgi:Uma2 family endonuclease
MGLERKGTYMPFGTIMEGMGTTTTPMTFEEFERLDFDADQVELLEGELIRMPPATSPHMDIVEALFLLLRAAVESCRERLQVGTVHVERGYLLPGPSKSWLQPDVSLAHPQQTSGRYYEGAPMLAFEVVSENDRASDLNAKVRKYLAHGAHEVWVIYPKERNAQVFHQSGKVALEDQKIHSDLLPGIEIPFQQFL